MKMLMESGAQLDAGDAIDQRRSMHEWLHDNTSGWIGWANQSVVEALEGYLSSLSPSRQEQVLEDENETDLVASWCTAKQPHAMAREGRNGAVTETINNKISGGEDNWVDANPNEPFSNKSLDKKDAKGCWRFDAKNGYDIDDKISAFNLRGEILDDGAINGCATAVDIDRVNMGALGQEMNHYILMRRPWKGKVPAGHAEPRWKIEFKWMSITIFTMVVTWEDLERLRMIVTHGAPCKMLDSNLDKGFSWEDMAEAARSGMEMEFVMQLFGILRAKDAVIPSSDNIDLATIRFEDSFVALAGCRIYWQKMLHFAVKGSVCLTHNIMIGDRFNLFDKEVSGLVRVLGEPGIFSKGKRSSITARENRQTNVQRDAHKHHSITCLVFRDAPENATEHDLAVAIVRHCGESRLEGTDRQPEQGKTLKEYLSFAEGGGGLFAPGSSVPRLAREHYEGEVRQNRGNPNARGSDLGTIVASESFIDPYAKVALKNEGVSDEFIVQAAGSSEKKNQAATRRDGTLQGFPEDGTRVFYTDIDTGSRESFVFRHELVLRGKHFYSLNDTFTKKAKGSGKGGNKKVERYELKLRLQYRRGMLELNSKKSGVGQANNSNWVVARVVYGPTAGNAPTPYTI